MAEQKKEQGGFPQNQTGGQDTHSTTGDGHPPRPGEQQGSQTGSGQGTGGSSNPGSAGGGTTGTGQTGGGSM